ncbi:MAG: hypothetical protein AAGA54_15970 [Myxococcota bacterium]
MDWLRRNVFLVDGLGAVASTIATLSITLAFQPLFGMPTRTLWGLVLLAVGFVAYSLSCWVRRAPLRPWLPVVMTANLAYCGVVAAALVAHTAEMTAFGTAYFAVEMVVIVGVVIVERAVLRADARP